MFYIGESILKFSHKSVCSELRTMLFYNKITESEELDTTEDTDVDRTGLGLLNSVTFVTSTFSKIEYLSISLIFAMDVMTLLYVLKQ